MANICTHIAAVSSTDKTVLEQVTAEISGTFECYSEIETGGGYCELEFCTPGAFPEHIMEGITRKHTGKNLYMQVITYEFSDELVQHHIYENGKWTDKQAERDHTKTNKYHNLMKGSEYERDAKDRG